MKKVLKVHLTIYQNGAPHSIETFSTIEAARKYARLQKIKKYVVTVTSMDKEKYWRMIKNYRFNS